MKKLIKKLIKKSIQTNAGIFILDKFIEQSMQIIKEVKYNACLLKFTTPNAINRFRASSFATKEPETLEWIDSFPNGSVVWDVGANVGIFSCYAAKHKKCSVFAFEPSVFNLELLARNISINNLQDMVVVVPLALTDKLDINSFNLSSTDWGGALSTFKEDYGHDGKKMPCVFRYRTIGIGMQNAVDFFKIPIPEYIKIDVDGIEHLILKGGVNILRFVRSILIEVNDDFKEQDTNVRKILTSSGFILNEKRHSDIVKNNRLSCNTYNQIWHRV